MKRKNKRERNKNLTSLYCFFPNKQGRICKKRKSQKSLVKKKKKDKYLDVFLSYKIIFYGI
jgi:hypothetical protein